MKQSILFGLFGLLFGFILQRVGATDYDAIAEMFLLSNLHLAGVIGVAVVVAGAGLAFIRSRQGTPAITPKARKPGNLVGGLIFGAGWALTGTCPGTGLAQLGEGKLMAIFTVAGIFLGTILYRRAGARFEGFLARRRAPEAPARDAPLPLG